MNSNSAEYQIRAVQIADLDQLFELLVALVTYEGLAERFKLSRTRLEEELFGAKADWHCLVAVDKEEHLIAFCLYTYANINRAFNLSPMIQVDDLYVSPEHRGAGIGQNLLHQLALIAKEKQIGRLNVWCMKDNEVGQRFYQRIGAEKRDFVDVYSIQVEALLEP
ncbi:ribosomal-protein-alanine acetyltransferase [Legionella massiliensis]|uniref:Ribosomal-protein-alanine acetyltransferase n=1 Tax=Legionella massiliensis TaxID=1034943 RepID=A0A078KX46_9GAMM|nr:GNAT family N-acetyltransferase [Legionella massiliensis]CDZ78990.1 ribosomal-protein-alanine acetyltransferase [Legionella massiliensis]CEE14728.1 Mycothiol acetyltransferase [Legionella massiliensis]